MKLLSLTLPSPAENLAADEALLNEIDHGVLETDVLRLWEPEQAFVVVGRASKVVEEVDLEYCQKEKIDVFRRCSGGATIVTGPGCLMYAIVLDLRRHPSLVSIGASHEYVLKRMRTAIESIGIRAQIRGTSDLTMGDQKFSGNSLRSKRNAILYHGTMLYHAKIEQISRCSRMPLRQPDYRKGKSHLDFIKNLPITVATLRKAIVDVWQTDGNLVEWPKIETAQLVKMRYQTREWNFRH